jgi:hypothetical protein
VIRVEHVDAVALFPKLRHDKRDFGDVAHVARFRPAVMTVVLKRLVAVQNRLNVLGADNRKIVLTLDKYL